MQRLALAEKGREGRDLLPRVALAQVRRQLLIMSSALASRRRHRAP